MLPKEFDDVCKIQLFLRLFACYNLFIVNRCKVFIIPYHVVDCHKHFPCDGNDGLFMAPAFFERQIFIIEIGMLFSAFDGGEGTLHHEWL